MKKIQNPNVMIERAVVAAVANVRSLKWRKQQMVNFATKYGDYSGSDLEAELEHECIRIIRSAGAKHARRLLTWFISIKTEVGFEPYPRFLPSQRTFEELKKAA